LGEPRDVPNVSGKPLLEAHARLTEAGFTVRYVVDEDSPAPSPTLLRQSPAPGTSVPERGIVTLVVGRLPEEPPDDEPGDGPGGGGPGGGPGGGGPGGGDDRRPGPGRPDGGVGPP